MLDSASVGETKLRHAAQTDVGRERDHNEDCLGVFADERLFIVADGMGGHNSGEIASMVAVDIVSELARKPGEGAPDDRLARAIEEANAKIHAAAAGSAALRGMGTTIVAALVEDGAAHIAHVGDSRAYRLHDGHLARLTKDHSLLQDYIDAVGGAVSEEEQKMFPQRNVLTRAVGIRETLEVARTHTELAAGDRLLLCSDGLYGMLDERTLRDCLAGIPDLDEAVKTLIERANGAGGTDNITAVVVEYVG